MKKILSVAVASLSLLGAVSAFGQGIVVVGAYAGGENDPDRVTDILVNYATDSSFAGVTLNNYNNVAWSSFASPGMADFTSGSGNASTSSYAFDGASLLYTNEGPQTYAQLNWGLEAWVYVTDTTPLQAIMVNGTGTNGYGLYVADGQWLGLVGSIGFVPSSAPAVANQWTHLAFVNQGGDNIIFVDGVQTGYLSAGALEPSDRFQLGGDAAGNSLTGYIDQARVFVFGDTFDPSFLNFAGGSAVPEPSTWALLGGCSALACAVLRPRRLRQGSRGVA